VTDGDSLGSLLARVAPSKGGFQVAIPENWMQGRTSYGGLSAALALQAARTEFTDLPPLRSAQIAFIGPLAGNIEIKVELLRRGRTAAYVQSDLYADGRLGLRALLVFMHAQQSHVDLPPPQLSGDALPALGEPSSPPPQVLFASHFEMRRAAPDPSSGAEFLRWARLRGRESMPADVELFAVADMLPPAAMRLFERQGPISSMTWQIDLLADQPHSDEGWWLLHAKADQARNGSSSQRMGIWNSRGEKVASGMQSVALFV
jgi:acyl-CoA thioesterase